MSDTTAIPEGAAAVSPGVWVYQITINGLALQLTLQGTKYYKHDDLVGKAGPVASTGIPLQAGLKVRKLSLATVGEGTGGTANLEGTLNSDGKLGKVAGALTLEKLKLVPKGAPGGGGSRPREKRPCST